MANLDHKIDLTLNEARILVLVTQVLIGFSYRGTFEPAFEQLPSTARYLLLGSLVLLLVALAILELCATYHIVVARGQNSVDIQRFGSRAIELALFPFAVSLGLGVYVVVGSQVGARAALASSTALVLAALWCWYGLGIWERHRRRHEPSTLAATAPKGEAMSAHDNQNAGGGTKLTVRIEQVLIEARMVLPGVQALLGFQLASMLVEGFDKLPPSSKYVHLASLGFIALAAILLMTPAAYHRIVEEGEDSERFFRFASRMVLAAMVPLALGIAGDFYVVVAKVTDSPMLAVASAVGALALFYGLWFGFTLYRRHQRHGMAPYHPLVAPAGLQPPSAPSSPPHQRSA